MSTPFDGVGHDRDDHPQDDGRDDFSPRISEEEQGIDALLRAGGEQWRSAVPAVEFARPSSRVALLGRGPRVVLSVGIAAAVVAIVLAGSALSGRPAASVGPQAPTGGTSAVPMTSAANSSSSLGTVRTLTELTVDFPPPSSTGSTRDVPTTAGQLPIGGIKDYPDAATERRVVGRVMEQSATNFDPDIRPGNTFPPVGSALWAAWDVRTGELLVGALGTSCSGEPLGMELTGSQELLVNLTVTAGTSRGTCSEQQWHVTSFLAPTGLDPWSDATVVTRQGRVALGAIGGIQGSLVLGSSEPTVAVPRSGGSAGPAVQMAWNPEEFRLLVSGPSTCPLAISGATSKDAGVTLDLETTGMTTGSCTVGTPTVTSVIRLPPQLGSGSFIVRYAGGVWTVPRTVLARSTATGGSSVDMWVEARDNELGITAVARTSDHRVAIRTECPDGATSIPEPVVRLVADHQVKVSGSSRLSPCTSGSADGQVFLFELPADFGLQTALTVQVDRTVIALPAG